MYTQFATVYDRLMQGIDYPAWAAHYLSLIRRAGQQPRAVCECACGTGLLTIELSRLGLSITASDLSQDMLEVASARARSAAQMIPFIAQDMRRLSLHRPTDAIVCACDGVNYLLTDADLAAFFCAAHANLKPGGVLAFDISSAHKLRDMCEQREFFEDLESLTYLWTNTWNDELSAVEMELCCFVMGDDGRYERFDEHQRQRAHSLPNLEGALHRAGFADVRVYGDMTFDPPGEGAQRIHITAIRQ